MFSHRPVAPMREKLCELERRIAGLRAEQIVLVNELERSQAPQTDGSRSMVEYVAANTDISHSLASELVLAARRIGHHRHINHRIAAEAITFDRTMATLKLAMAGASRSDIEASYNMDLDGVRRITTTRTRMTRSAERTVHEGRYFTSQPNLDRTSYRFTGLLPGADGHILEQAMVERADELRQQFPDVETTRNQRHADAMVAMAHDSLDRIHNADDHTCDTIAPSSGGGTVSVFIDARHQDAAETTAEIAYGARVGPNTLEELLCTGSVRIIAMDGATPVSTSPTSRRIPPAIRDAVAARDGFCTINGCRSRYRLQPHHITPYSKGGTHHPDNLTTLCWYHHHVAIHQHGYLIDPHSPPQRRTLIPPHPGPNRGPPDPFVWPALLR